MPSIPVAKWKWFGHAAHLIVGHDCRFHMTTVVGKYLVSTVGEYWPPRSVREIHAKYNDPAWLDANQHLKGDYFDAAYMQRFGFETIGCDRKYETMVFLAGNPCASKSCGCGLPSISGSELDFGGYNDARSASRGHYALCAKYAKKRTKQSGGAS